MFCWIKSFPIKLGKPVVTAGSCVVLGVSAYALYLYFKYKRRMIDEGFVDQNVIEESTKKILVLGLEGAGKSTFLSHLSKLERKIYEPDNAKVFNVLSIQCYPHKTFNFWEVGGSTENRIYWFNLVQDSDLLIYLVDSADEHKLAESVKELHILLACDKLKNVPIFILANKQDLKNASIASDIAAAFEVPELSKSLKIAVYPLEMPPDTDVCSQNLIHIKNILVHLLCKK